MNIPASPDQPAQPQDSDHQGGKSTYLQCMTQNMIISSAQFGSGAYQLTGGDGSPAAYVPPNPSSSNTPAAHRYMSLLFEQPPNFSIPANMQVMINGRQNFDLREFIQQCNLPLPTWSNFFVCSRNGQSLTTSFTQGVGTFTSISTYTVQTPITSTVTVGKSIH